MTRGLVLRILGVAAIVALVFAARSLPLADWLAGTEAWVQENPVLGAVGYVGLTTLAAVLLLPGWVPMALAGLLFGLLPGIAYGALGVTGGATAAMLAGRTLARPWVAKRIEGNSQLSALDEALGHQAFLIVFLTRVAMVLPFNLLNFAYGLTRVGLPTYVGATALGMLPVVALYAYLGTLAADIGALLDGDVKPAGGWWVVLTGALAITIVIIVVRRTVQRVLEQKLESGSDESQPGSDEPSS